jgi:hypothetical protein
MTNFNTNDELKIEELDAIVGGGQCGGGVNWGQVGRAINKVNIGVGVAMSGGVGGAYLAGAGAVAFVLE